jgi:hypothetical protein
MQLRVARLCLDCEELHLENSCPVCASDRYAFLSAWLPSEERRRWRQPAPRPVPGERGPIAVLRRVGRWFRVGESEAPRTLRTRASDHVTRLDFDGPGEEPRQPPTPVARPAKRDLR